MKYAVLILVTFGITLTAFGQQTTKQMGDKEFLGLRTVIYKVPDLEKAKKWYADIFNTPPYFDEPFYVGFDISGYELGLLPAEDRTETNNEIVYWGVNDIQSAYERLLDLGAKPFEKPENVGGEVMTATVKDPWGNVLGIIYNPHFKAGNQQ